MFGEIMDDFDNETVPCLINLDDLNSTAEMFGLVVPRNVPYWSERTESWWAFFYIMLIVYGGCFLSLAIVSLLLLMKRHLAQRFKTRTFIAIDISLMVLGISRVLFFILDPWGQSNFCMGHTACRVISRLLSALAFPSLTASYTLVFITLWMSARIQLGQSSYQRYKVLVPLCFVHYAVAITFEIIGSIPWPGTGAHTVTFLLIGCEAVFSLWGFLVCFAYLFAGYRLLHSVEKSARSSSMICRDSPQMTRQQLVEKSKFQNQKQRARTRSTLKLKDMVREHHRRAIRKVSIIMYVTVALGMLYSVLSLVNLTLVILSIFDGCPGHITGMEQQHPEVWLFLRYIFFTLELLLALLLMYSITDFRPVIIFLRGCVRQCCRLKVGSPSRKQSPEIALATSSANTVPHSPSCLANSKFNYKVDGTPKSPLKVRIRIDSDAVSDPANVTINVQTKFSEEEDNFEVPGIISGPPSPSLSDNFQAKSDIPAMPQLSTTPSTHRVRLNSSPTNPSPLTVSFSIDKNDMG